MSNAVNHPNQGTHAPPTVVADGPARKKVIILAMGSSRTDFDAMQLVEQRPDLLQDAQIWGINYMGAIKRLDRIIHVDPVHRYLGHGPVKDMCDYALKDNIPLYTSWPHPFYMNHVLYPADKVFQTFGHNYFNNSVAWAIGLAGAEGFTDIGLFGADFSYPNAHLSEAGRACCEFLLGTLANRGVRIAIAATSTLLDLYCQQQPYGFFADPNVPPSTPGGRLMGMQEIVAHCQRQRDTARLGKPQIYAYGMQTQLPQVVAPIVGMTAEHLTAPSLANIGPVIVPPLSPPLADGSMSQQQAEQAPGLVREFAPVAGAGTHEANIV